MAKTVMHRFDRFTAWMAAQAVDLLQAYEFGSASTALMSRARPVVRL